MRFARNCFRTRMGVAAVHEVGLMEEVLKAVAESARERGLDRVEKIQLVVGRLNSALPHALQMAFAALAADRPLFSEAELAIAQPEVRVECRNCGTEHTGKRLPHGCPECDSRNLEILTGDELFIDYYEAEEGEKGKCE